jgi:acyl carrier protein
VTHIFAVPMLWHTIEKQVWAEAAKQGQKQEEKLRKALAFTTALQNIFPVLGAEVAKRLMRQVTDKLFGTSVKFCINGGSYLRDSAMELLNGIGYGMHNGYGMSEIGITSVELRRRPKYRNRNSIGHPFDSVRYRIDADGILQVKGSSLCIKKLINGESAIIGEWFDTGDRMECIDGHYYIHGRRSDVVIGDNGENINPDMVEKAFMPQGVQQLSVLGLPGENGQELALVAQVSPYITQVQVDRVREYLYSVNNTFPAASAVKAFYFTFDEIVPPNAVKVSRKQLLQKIEAGDVKLVSIQQFCQNLSEETEQTALMRQVCKIIAQTLDIEESQVTAQAHIFYDLGATSIQYFSVVAALAEHFSITQYTDNTYYYTPKEICEYIESKL